MRRERVEIEFIGRNLPGSQYNERLNVRVGVQVGERVEQDVSAESEVALFRLFVMVREGKEPGTLDFGGEYVKGTAEERFVYLSWGTRDGETYEMFARTKVPLTRVTSELIAKAAQEGRPLRALLRLTDAKGRTSAALRDAERISWE